MESEREGQAVFPCRFSHTHAHLHGLLGGYLYSNYRLFAYCIYNSTDRRVCLFVFFFKSSFVFRTVFKEKEMGSGQELRAEQGPACRDQNEK